MKYRTTLFALLLGGVTPGILLAQEDTREAKAVVGRVTGVSPSNAVLNVAARFFVTGIAMPETLAFAVADAECAKVTSNPAQAVFDCIPRATGSKSYVVKDKPGGTSLASGVMLIGGAAAAPAPQPQPVPAPQSTMNISSATPAGTSATAAATLMLNQPATFNLYGSDLTSGQIRISLTNCDGSSVQALSPTQARFSCTPRAAGTQRLFWKRPGSEAEITLAQYNVSQPAPQPVTPPAAVMNITSATPATTLMLNQPATFNLYGSDLTSGQIRISLTNCDGSSVQALSPTQARFSCTPRAAETQRLFWKRPGSEAEITLAQINVGQVVQAPQPQTPIGQVNADPHEMWRNWQSGAAAVKTQQLRDGRAGTLSPAEIIYYSAQENGINPVTIISKLQGEQGLIEANYAGEELKSRLELATGYGARVGAKWFGFYPQVVGLSYQFDQFAQQKMAFGIAYQTYTQDARGPFSQYQTIYAKYAAVLNRIAGTNYAATPSDQGYYRDFANVGPQAIQALLQQMGGTLGNARLFGGSGLIGSGNVAVPPPTQNNPAIGSNLYSVQSVSPISGIVGQKVTFSVQGNLPNTIVINLQGERCYNESKPAPNQVVCEVSRTGVNPQLEVKDKSGGQVLRTFSFEGKAVNQGSGKLAAPLASLAVTQPFGNFLSTYAGIAYNGYHTGTDFRGGVGTPVFAIADGTVTRATVAAASGNAGLLGWYVVIEHPALNVRSVYVHTERPTIAVGSTVHAGQQIAVLGSPKLVPSHLHIEIQRLDKKVINSKGNFTPFVGKSTAPVGNRGYVAKQQDLNAVWLNPVPFLNGSAAAKAEIPNAQFAIQNAPIDLTSHAFSEDVQGDDPPAVEQLTRQQVLDQIANFAVSKRIAQSAAISEMQRLGIFRGTTLSRPTESASRMEVALMAQRLLQPLNVPVANSGNRFAIEEFGSTPEATDQDYQSVVNGLYQWGIINGQQDHLGNWRFYPTRKVSSYELGEILARMKVAVPMVSSVATPATQSNPSASSSTMPQNPATDQVPTNVVNVSVSNPNPAVGETVFVNVNGTLPPGQASDIYLYLKVAQLGGQVTWYYNKRLNDDIARPWRANISGPGFPETNPIFQYVPRVKGDYAVGVLILPAGSPVNLRFTNETTFIVKN